MNREIIFYETDKTPYSEIVKANRLKNEYFKNKKNG